MSQVEEGVNIEHLLVEAMHNNSSNLPLHEDPLPSAEEIAGAKAAAAGAAHSTYSAAAVPAAPVKGLGGAGLNLKRKGGGKAGNSSTISAATAPPALLGNNPRAGAAGGGRPAGSNLGASNLSSRAAPVAPAAPSAPAPAATAAAAAAPSVDAAGEGVAGAVGGPEASLSGLPTPDGSRSLEKDDAGVRSFRTALSPDTEDGSLDWESSASNSDEIKAAPATAATATSSNSSWGASISSMLEDFADPSALALCGVVLGACASALLVLGTKAWLNSRQ